MKYNVQKQVVKGSRMSYTLPRSQCLCWTAKDGSLVYKEDYEKEKYNKHVLCFINRNIVPYNFNVFKDIFWNNIKERKTLF